MMRCEHCRPLILDHLYGLLDEPDTVAIEAHLLECVACSAARNEAARVQGLIARAAKGAFPAVRFEPPVTRPAPVPAAKPSASQTIPFPLVFPVAPLTPDGTPSRSGKTARIAFWLPWAVAAAVLLAIPGTVIPVLGMLDRARATRTSAEESVARVTTAIDETEKAVQEVDRQRAQASHKLTTARQIVDGLLAKWVAEEKAAVQNLTARKVTVDVLKPATVQPGAPNEFLLVVHDLGGDPNARVLAEVRDQTDAVIYSQQLDHERKGASHPLRLPAEVWTRLNPQSELFLVVSSVEEKSGAKTELQDKVRLLGPVFSTMLVTDRPAYRPGEVVYFRSLTLDRITFHPPAHEQLLQYELRGPHRHLVHNGATRYQLTGGTDLVRVAEGKVDPVLGPDNKPIRGVGCGGFTLPADLPDGDYTLVLRELPHPAGYPASIPFLVTRPVKIRSGPADAYAKQTGYAAASYAAGDTVEAWAELKFQDRPVAGAEVTAVAVADNVQLGTVATERVTGPDGRANLRFTLPRNLEQADVRLKVTFKTKTGQEESVADRVPVIGRNVIVEFFPEGGELVAGVDCRVYVRATTPAGQPVDFRGVVTDGRRTLARVETLTDPTQPGANRGIGEFTYKPELGIPVWLKLESPVGAFAPLLDGPLPIGPAVVAGIPAALGIRSGFLLPKPLAEGVVLTIRNPVTVPGEPIRVRLQSVGRTRNLVVGAYTRGRLSDTQRITVKARELAEVRLMAGTDPRGGVVRVTVFEEPSEQLDAKPDVKADLKAVAERLVYRKPGETLRLSYTTSGTVGVTPQAVLGGAAGAATTGFVPNTPVELSLTATDEKGNPAAAILWATAFNTGVAPGVKDRLLTTHFLLAGEVNTPDAMEYADYLLTDHPKAAAALDLVLATQGWRRFAEQIPQGFANRPVVANAECIKLLTGNGQYVTWAEPAGNREHRKVYETYWPRYEAATKALAEAQTANEAAAADRTAENRARELARATQQARDEANTLVERANASSASIERFRSAGRYAIAGFGLLAVMLGALSLARPAGRFPLGVGTIGSVGLVAFLVITLGMADQVQATARMPEETAKLQGDTWPAFKAPVVPPPVAAQGLPGADASPRTGAMPGRGGAPELPGKGRMSAEGVLGRPAFGGSPKGPVPLVALPPVQHDKTGNVKPMAGSLGGAAPSGPASGLPGGSVRPAATAVQIAPSALPAIPTGPAIPAGGAPLFVPAKGDGGGLPSGGKKVVSDAELARSIDPYRLQTPSHLRRDVGLADGTTRSEEKMKRVFAQARDYATDRARALSGKMDEFAAKNGLMEKQNVGDKPVATKDVAKAVPPDLQAAYNRVKATVPTITPLVVREYAAPRPGSVGPEGETSDTILWQPVIVLPSDGKAKFIFGLGAAPGGYQVVIAGHTLDGRIGAIRGLIPVAPAKPPSTALPATVPPTMP